jgi:hypothetical protein
MTLSSLKEKKFKSNKKIAKKIFLMSNSLPIMETLLSASTKKYFTLRSMI